MLPKNRRAGTQEVDQIFKEGRSVTSSTFHFKFIRRKDSLPPKVSFVAPKGIAKIAVKRNLLRRRGYLALKKRINGFPLGISGVFIFKKYQDDSSIISDEIKAILDKIN